MDTPVGSTDRPLGAAIGAALLGVAALAGLIFGPYLAVIGYVVGKDVGGDPGRVVFTLELMLGVGCAILAIVSIMAARGLLRGRTWAWAAALFVGLVLVIVTAVLWIEDRWLPSYALIGVLGAALVVTLLPASVRRASGI